MNCINDFRKEHRWLSNFADSTIEYDGMIYDTVEHAYQASKTDNIDEKLVIQRCVSAKEARNKGQLVTMRKDFELIKCRIMAELVHLKFNLPHYAEMLRNTGNAKLIEGNGWHDNYFGICYCDQCKGLLGANVLGTILMLERSKL